MSNSPLTAPLMAALLLFGACGKKPDAKSAGAPQKEEAKAVRVVIAAEKEIDRTVFANGALAARDQAVLSAKVSGRVEEIPVDVGSVVKRGDVLCQIQKRDYELGVQQSRAALAAARARLGLPLEGLDDAIDVRQSSLAKEARAQLDEQTKNRDRIAKLREQGILSESELETAESAYQVGLTKYEEAIQETNNRKATLAQRRAELNIAEQKLTDTAVRAPFDGVVQERRASPGEYLMEGAPLAMLVRIDPIRLRLEAPERESVNIRGGQRIRFRVDGDTNFYAGQVDRISPAIAADNRMLQVEADIPNDGRLRPGAFVRAEIATQTARVVMTPRNAVVAFAGIEKVFVHENGKAAERRVTTGAVKGDEVEVIKGLKAGEAVILDPGSMRAGQPVTITQEVSERADSRSSGG